MATNNNIPEFMESIFIVDSIGKTLENVYKTTVMAHPGAKIGDIEHLIINNTIIVSGFKYITILIGTNDLTPKEMWYEYGDSGYKGRDTSHLFAHKYTTTSPDIIENRYKKLLQAIKMKNYTANIIVVVILL